MASLIERSFPGTISPSGPYSNILQIETIEKLNLFLKGKKMVDTQDLDTRYFVLSLREYFEICRPWNFPIKALPEYSRVLSAIGSHQTPSSLLISFSSQVSSPFSLLVPLIFPCKFYQPSSLY
jgi:hypothetical protein